MKEFSIEEKAKRYDEALEKFDVILNLNIVKERGSISTDDVRKIFPELKESEDERVRKWIKKELESKYVVDNIVNNVMADKALAWIEKQCEQKSKFRVGDTIKNKYDDRQFTIKSVDLDKGAYTYTQEGCGNDIDYADEEFELVEQKPVAWSEEDEKAVNDIMWIIEAYRKNGFNETHIQIADSSENWLKSLKEKYTWKPTEEQIKALHNLNLTGDISYMGQGQTLLELYNDLKKL